jgi:hypothetical protein
MELVEVVPEVINETPETKQNSIKKITHEELAFLKKRRHPWKSRIRRSTFLPMIPRPGFGNIIHIKHRLSHKLKR